MRKEYIRIFVSNMSIEKNSERKVEPDDVRSEKSDLYERLAEETEEMDHKIIRKE